MRLHCTERTQTTKEAMELNLKKGKKKKKLGNRPEFLSLLYHTNYVIDKLRQVTLIYASSSMKWEE